MSYSNNTNNLPVSCRLTRYPIAVKVSLPWLSTRCTLAFEIEATSRAKADAIVASFIQEAYPTGKIISLECLE